VSKLREILDLPVEGLKPHPNQPAHRNSVDELVASIKEIGLQEPILATEDKDGWTIIAGHRRVAAYKVLGFKTIPAQVVKGATMAHENALAYTTQQLAASNTAREDFTAVQEAQVMQLMIELGIGYEKVAASMGRKPKDVEAVVAAVKAIYPGTVKRFESDAELTTDEILVLGEFAGNEEATKELLESLEGDQFEHRAMFWRKKREAEAARLACATEIEGQGIHVIDKPSWDDKKVITLERVGIKPAKHQDCTGHAAYVSLSYDNKATAVYVCTDAPAYHKYKPAANSGAQQADLDKKRLGLQFKKDMVAPTQVRREWITAKLKADTPWKKEWEFIAHALANRNSTTHEVVYELASIKRKKDEDWTAAFISKDEKRSHRIALALTIGYMDEETRLCMGTDHFRATHVPHYLTFLKLNGYTLSEHEAKFLG
jgi:ParB/RepB/Spo0J family partition protein